jgi:phosphoribosylformimino-5-aminoimidazole carboxamide ribotide isomerase
MQVIPAIDIIDGKCVRLFQGDYNKETVYSDDPVAVALNWKALGASKLHIIDLDGAAAGESRNMATIEAIVKETGLPIQLGGGIRDKATVERLMTTGIKQVIIGTAAIEHPEIVEELCQEYNEAIIVGVDARDGNVATHGWMKDTEVTVLELGQRMVKIGVKHILYTDIKRDGTLTGPDYKTITQLVNKLNSSIIAAGGISELDHLMKLKELGVEGAVIGKALYTKNIILKEALAIERESA